MKDLKEAKEKYVGKYFILHGDNEDNIFHCPTRHKLIHIGDLNQCRDKIDLGYKVMTNCIEISQGVSVQWEGGLGACKGSMQWLSALMVEEEKLEEITKEEFMEIYGLVYRLHDNVKYYVSELK